VKENANIEDLFKDKFENFEANVDPSVWANVSQSINSVAAAGSGSAAAGISGIAKVAVITAAVAVTSVGVWYFTKDSDTTPTEQEQTTITTQDNLEEDENTVAIVEEDIQVSDTNDPVIQEYMQEIQEDFTAVEISTQSFDPELIDILKENHSTTSTNNNTTSSDSNLQTDDVVTDQSTQEVDASDNETSENEKIQPNVTKKIKTDLVYEVEGADLIFKSGAKNHNKVEWNFGDGHTATGDEGTHTYEKPGRYNATMTVLGDNSKKVIDFSINIEGTSEISFIPNVITANNDGSNDYFYIESTDIEEFLIVIYDMSNGQEVFRSEDPDFRWSGERPDGTVKEGNYIFKIIAIGSDGAKHEEAKQLHISK
jgi:hypothetical protein